MGGQNSRMVKEIMEDSLYIIRQTNRATYDRSVQAHQEVASKIEELREMNKQMLHSTQQDDVRSELFKTLQGVDSKKKQLDEVRMRAATQPTILCYFDQVDGFAKQFELPKSYQKIADTHRIDLQKVKEAAEAAAKKADKL